MTNFTTATAIERPPARPQFTQGLGRSLTVNTRALQSGFNNNSGGGFSGGGGGGFSGGGGGFSGGGGY